MKNLQPGSDMYIGIGCGFVFVLAVALIIGVPWRDAGIWAVVFLILGIAFVQIVKRRQNRKP